MGKHCKGCIYHSNAGHPKNSPFSRYNDWCTHHSNITKRAQSICKLQDSKRSR